MHARRHSGHEILSQPIKVEVYAPLRIYPQDVFLAPGASYVVCAISIILIYLTHLGYQVVSLI